MSRRGLTAAAVAAAGALTLAGCGFKGAYSLPLPGGSASGPVYHVTAEFADVQDLVPMSAVRVDDVAVGDVTSISYDATHHLADVHMRIRKSVRLPANAIATLEQTTLLGEKYVALSPPNNQPAEGTLTNNAVIRYNDGRTGDLPDVEEVFGVLSAVLNGSSLQDLQTIDIEVTKALAGREQDVRGALAQLDIFVNGLNSQRAQIVRALDQLDRLSAALAQQNGTLATALDQLGPGLKVLADERAQFVGLLSDLSRFGAIATRIIRASRQQTVAGLRDLQPVLAHLRAAGTNLPRSLELLITYPFPRDINRAVPGDYNGLYLSFNADPVFCQIVKSAGLSLPTCPATTPLTAPGAPGTRRAPSKSGGGTTSPVSPPPVTVPSGLPLPLPTVSPLPLGDVIAQFLRAGLVGVS